MVEEKRPADASKVPATREAAAAACEEQTRKKGIKSMTAIFSRLRPGKADEDFAACMREYETGGTVPADAAQTGEAAPVATDAAGE
jgi:hypothetical protein